jgi:RNAse (barnase) inhibitor barstar
MQKPEYEIDGTLFATLDQFFEEVGRTLIPQVQWGHNLNALNDILRGGFGTPEGGFILRWKNSQVSRERLGYPLTVRHLEKQLKTCHASTRDLVRRDLEQARIGVGPTVFDWLVEIIRDHEDGGEEASDGVQLILE